MLDLPRLRMLMAIHAEGSIAAAARTLNYTPAAVSQQLSTLAPATGLCLFLRHSRGVTLTPPGEELAGAGREVILRLAQAEDNARQLAGLEKAKLRIATFQSASAGLLPKILAPLCQRFPRMSLEFVEVPRAEAFQLLRQHDAGEELAGAGREVILRLAQAEDNARQLAGLEKAKLRIATFQSASAGLLPKILAPLCQRFPRMSLEFVEVPRAEAFQLLRQHDAD